VEGNEGESVTQAVAAPSAVVIVVDAGLGRP